MFNDRLQSIGSKLLYIEATPVGRMTLVTCLVVGSCLEAGVVILLVCVEV